MVMQQQKNVPFMQRTLVSVHLCCVLCMLLVAIATRLFSHSLQTTVALSRLFGGFCYCFALHCVGYNTVTAIKYFGSQQNKCLKIRIITLIYPISPLHKI